MVKLYDKLGNTFIANLENCIECFVEEERNGVFELTLSYPNNYPFADQLIDENIIIAKANDTMLDQKFRIYDTKKFMKNTITVFARHISFDLLNDHIESIDLTNASCEYVLNTLFRNSHFSQSYRGYSDIVNAQNFKIDNANILNAIGGKKGSLIDTFGTGAEILRDNNEIHVLNRRGHDNDVTIEYGKNLTEFTLERDLSELETRVGGFAKYQPEGSREEVIVKSDWINSPFINNFSHPYISSEGRRDYSDKFKDGEVPNREKLNKLCQDEFKINKRDIPKTNYTIKFIPLSKCIGYEELKDKISLCDVVTIKDYRFNVNTQAKVIKYKFDVLKDRYESMEVGEPKTNLGDIIGSGEIGPPGPPGADGIDGKPGDLNDFPNTLPSVPTLTTSVYGFASIELSWTFENKLYYNYELYASKVKDFTPNVFDLIFQGQASTFLHQVKPNETWYYRVRATNTHGRGTEFSSQIIAATKKVDDMENYFTSAAIGNAVVGSLTADYMQAGIIKGNWIDAKQLSVTDGNGKRTLDIDSYGNVNLDVANLSINAKDVEEILTEQDKKLKSVELKVTPEKIISSVNEQLGNGGAIKGVATVIDKDKFLVKDSSGGSIAMDNGTVVMKNGNDKKMIALEERKLKLYNRSGTNREEGNISSILSGDDTGGIGMYARNHEGSKVDLGIENYDGSITLFFRGVKGRIDLWQRTVANKEIYCHEDILARNFIKTVATIPLGLEKSTIKTEEGTGIDLYKCILDLTTEINKLKDEIKTLKG